MLWYLYYVLLIWPFWLVVDGFLPSVILSKIPPAKRWKLPSGSLKETPSMECLDFPTTGIVKSPSEKQNQVWGKVLIIRGMGSVNGFVRGLNLPSVAQKENTLCEAMKIPSGYWCGKPLSR